MVRLVLCSMQNKGPAVTVDVIYFSLGHLRWGLFRAELLQNDLTFIWIARKHHFATFQQSAGYAVRNTERAELRGLVLPGW